MLPWKLIPIDLQITNSGVDAPEMASLIAAARDLNMDEGLVDSEVEEASRLLEQTSITHHTNTSIQHQTNNSIAQQINTSIDNVSTAPVMQRTSKAFRSRLFS